MLEILSKTLAPLHMQKKNNDVTPTPPTSNTISHSVCFVWKAMFEIEQNRITFLKVLLKQNNDFKL